MLDVMGPLACINDTPQHENSGSENIFKVNLLIQGRPIDSVLANTHQEDEKMRSAVDSKMHRRQ